MKFSIFAILFFSPLLVFAQIAPQEIEGNKDWETWYKKIPVSGEIRAGLMTSFHTDNKLHPSFFAQIPKNGNSTLCVNISSNDGRYSAKLTYDISNLNPGIHEFSWPTKFLKDLREFSTENISILSKLGDDCNDEDAQYVLSGWTDLDSKENIWIILNSERTPMIHIRNKSTRKSLEFECEKLKDQRNVAFNCSCKVPISEICDDCEIAVVQRIRRGPHVTFNRYPMPIKL